MTICYIVLNQTFNVATAPILIFTFIMKRPSPGFYCEGTAAQPPVLGGGVVRRCVDAAEAGECEALTGRWWRAAVGAQSPVKCVCSSEHNTGLPPHRGKHVPAPDHCCMSLLLLLLLCNIF